MNEPTNKEFIGYLVLVLTIVLFFFYILPGLQSCKKQAEDRREAEKLELMTARYLAWRKLSRDNLLVTLEEFTLLYNSKLIKQ